LTLQQQSVLECIFVLGNAKKIALLELTEFAQDDLMDCQNLLSKTSLIEHVMSETEDFLVISSAVRELLARFPLNLELRSFYSKKLIASNLKIQNRANDIIDTFSFSEKTPSILMALGGKLPKLWANQAVALTANDEDYIRNFEEKITNYESSCREFEDYYRLRAYSRALLRDAEMALLFARQGSEVAPQSLVACQVYANLLISANKNFEARNVLSPFVKDFLKKISDGHDLLQTYGPAIIRETFSSFFKTFIWSGEYKEVVKFTEYWTKTPDYLKIIFVISRSAALRRINDRIIQSDRDRCIAFGECARLLIYCFRESGSHVRPLVREAIKVRHEIVNRIGIVPEEFKEGFFDSARVLTKFIGDNHSIGSMQPTSAESERGEAAFHSDKPQQGDANKHRATIYSLKSTFCFAQSESGEQYFIPFANFEDGSIPYRVGDAVLVWDVSAEKAANGSSRAGGARLL